MSPLPKNTFVKITSLLLLLTFLPQPALPQKRVEAVPALFQYCGQYSLPVNDNQSIASDNAEGLFIQSSFGKLISITGGTFTGGTFSKIWETDLGGEIISRTFVEGNKIFIVTKNRKNKISETVPKTEAPSNNENEAKISDISDGATILHALNKTTGVTEWRIELGRYQKAYLSGFYDNVILAADEGEFFSISKKNGKINWRQNLASELSAIPYRSSDKIHAATIDRHFYTIDLNGGQILIRTELPEPPTVILTDATGKQIITGDRKGSIRSFNLEGKFQNWRSRQGAEISVLKRIPNGLLAASFDNFVYLIDEKSGRLIWKKRLPGRIAAVPLVTADYLIAAALDESTASVISLADGRTLNKLTLEEGNFFTGSSLQLNKLFVFAVRRGVVEFSSSVEGCRENKNS